MAYRARRGIRGWSLCFDQDRPLRQLEGEEVGREIAPGEQLVQCYLVHDRVYKPILRATFVVVSDEYWSSWLVSRSIQ